MIVLEIPNSMTDLEKNNIGLRMNALSLVYYNLLNNCQQIRGNDGLVGDLDCMLISDSGIKPLKWMLGVYAYKY
jgi:hypothetical protein